MKTSLFIFLFCSLMLGTAALEIATGLMCVVALFLGDRSGMALLGPTLAIVVGMSFAAVGLSVEHWVEVLGLSWPLLLALAVPMLVGSLNQVQLRWVERVGLSTAALVGGVVAMQTLFDGEMFSSVGLFSHHLTLGYALVIPLARALYLRSWICALAMATGVISTGASGPVLAMVVVSVGLWNPLVALVGGMLFSVGIMWGLGADEELAQRALLWATGMDLSLNELWGTGPDGFRQAAMEVQQRLQPGFYFPFHAHDAFLQRSAIAGMAIWVAWGWFLMVLWRQSHGPGRAALVGILVGGLTQDTLGDLEVIRGLCAWALLPLVDTESEKA